MKKALKPFFTFVLIALFVCALTACSSLTGSSTNDKDSLDAIVEEQIFEAYKMYKAEGGTLSYEDWLTTIKGEKGEKGSDGAPGRGITRVYIDEEGNLVVVYTDDTESEVGKFTADCDCVAHPHDIVEKTIVEREPTCTQTGITYIICETCREAIKTIITEEKPHNYTDVVTEPTCTEQGYTTHTCTDCGDVVVDSYVPAGHIEVIDEAVAPTCTKMGLTEGKHCSVCNEVLIAQEEVPALGHVEVIDEAVAPTCTETGLTEGKHCSVCHEVLIAQEEVPALGHNYEDEICTRCGYEYEGTEGLVYQDNGTHYFVIGYEGTETEVIIPKRYEGKAVTSIGISAFNECSGLTSITIPNSVTSIEYSAFLNCTGLTSVYYTGDIVSWCGISFGNNVSNPLYYAHNLYINNGLVTEIVVPDTVTEIKEYAFYGWNGTSIMIPDSVTSIGRSTFGKCGSLTSITIPDSVTSIGEMAFADCISLSSITISDSVTSIKDGAFSNCVGLNGVYYIGDIASWCVILFYDSYSNPLRFAQNLYVEGKKITDLVIPNNVTEIKDNAFYGWNGTSITISDSVTSIGNNSFYYCSNVTSITIGNGVTSIGNDAFSYCSGLTSITFTGTQAQWDAIEKGTNWNYNTGSYTIHCTDGDIEK